MKLRARSRSRSRSLVTKETIHVEIDDSSSLLDLKTLIAGKLSSPSPSSSFYSISPESIALSLNRDDEFFSSSPAESLKSLGLTSGDLVFYSQFLTLAPPPKTPNPATANDSISSPISVPIHQEMDVETKNEVLFPDSNETLVTDMEVDTPPMEESESVSKSPSVPCLLKRVMDLEKEEIKGNLGFLVVAVHAVFLESGFVVCDGDGDGLCLPKDWNSASTAAVSIRYTVPELLGGGEIEANDVKVASLKFSLMSNHVSVYGFLNGEPDIYRLHLDLAKVVPLLVFLSDAVSGEEEKEVFRFWKTVKDRLCLALLIDICEKNGLPLPPCFTRLPTDIKLKFLKLLPGVDVAKFGCTGSEMKYLTLNDELWKQKFMEEFGQVRENEVTPVSSWKEKFKHCWIKRRDAQKAMRDLRENRHRYPRGFLQRYPPFAPQRFPFFGGDYDLSPVFGVPYSM